MFSNLEAPSIHHLRIFWFLFFPREVSATRFLANRDRGQEVVFYDFVAPDYLRTNCVGLFRARIEHVESFVTAHDCVKLFAPV